MRNEILHQDASERSASEIQNRLDQLSEIIESFRTSPTGSRGYEKRMNAIEEQAGLRQELESLESRSSHSEPLQPERPVFPIMSQQEKSQREQAELYQGDVATLISEFLGDSFFHPELKIVVEKLKDSNNVTQLLNEQIGIEYFLQNIKDPRVMKQVIHALKGFYFKVKKQEYPWKRAA